ncbi:asparagine oxygenase [Fusarium globosum]|uniref:Asparagine oxygenase n=1 Tax=Fusarium globosum TaxID=78864 RepID=A0A8H5XZ84_9HYPO|nr:asparagine oxygenase [Fusarium globosum]
MTHRLSRLTRFGVLGPTYPCHFIRSHGTLQRSPRVLDAPHISCARDPGHVYEVAAELQSSGLLKVCLGFPDDSSDYLRDLISSMHKHHGHHLPIAHSATRGWFWDVRPKPAAATGAHQARSETMSEFAWHTDCSYEDSLPRYFALQVLQHDRYGGGTLSAMNVASLIGFLSPETRKALMAPEFRMQIPPEFIKDPEKSFITGSILVPDPHSIIIRYRHDIIEALTTRAAKALEELSAVLVRREVQASSTMHLKPSELPKGSIILMDNRRWMHARNEIRDPERHLRRVRWDARTFSISNRDT